MKTMLIASSSVVLFMALACCNKKEKIIESDTLNNAQGKEVVQIDSQKNSSPEIVFLDSGHRYLLVADYTKPAALGHVPFCLLDLSKIKAKSIAVKVSLTPTLSNTVINVDIDLLFDKEPTRQLRYSRSTVAGLHFEHKNNIAPKKNDGLLVYSHATFGKHDQTSEIFTILGNDLDEMKSKIKISSSYPFWKWRPDILE